MARRRDHEKVASEDELESDILQSEDDEDLLDEEEGRERLLSKPRSGLSGWLSRPVDDPNAPIRMTERDERGGRKQSGRSKRRRREEEDSLMDEAGRERGDDDEDASGSGDSVDSTSLAREGDSGKRKKELQRLDPRRKRFKRVLQFFLMPFLLVASFVGLYLGAWKLSNRNPLAAAFPSHLTIRSNGTHNFAPTTILVSLDGFRADFLNRGLTPTLLSFIAQGVSPEYMLPSFPSVTFPNHWTLVTGLHPESHGVVGNQFWDPELQEEFFYTDPSRSMQPKWWEVNGVEPLWAVAERQGIRSAIHMWPGSEAGLQPKPTYLDRYRGDEPLDRKVDRVLGFFDLESPFDSIPPEALSTTTTMSNLTTSLPTVTSPRPQFLAVYVPNVDTDGHKYGPNSTEILKTISSVDSMVGSLLGGLEARNLTSIVNVVVVSDHGMATTSSTRLIQLESLIDPEILAHIDGWPLYGLRLKPGNDLHEVYEDLQNKQRSYAFDHPSPGGEAPFTVHLRSDMPDRFHFNASDRIAPLWLIPAAGWAIVTKEEFDLGAHSNKNAVYSPRGLHGYDHEHPLMRAIFVARGPAFPHEGGSKVAAFQNTEVYGIVGQSLGVDLSEGVVGRGHNGTLRLPLTVEGKHDGAGNKDVADLPSENVAQEDDEHKEKEGDQEKSNGDDEMPDGPTGDESSKLHDLYSKFKDKLEQFGSWVKGIFSAKVEGQDEEARL